MTLSDYFCKDVMWGDYYGMIVGNLAFKKEQ